MGTEWKLGPADRSLLSAQVVTEIRRAILSGALPPGTRVVEADIAAQMGISRSPVREAMVQLEHEGLIVRHPHRGTTVAVLSPEDAREIASLRAYLEAFAYRLAAPHLTDDDFSHLEGIVDRMREAGDDLAGVIELDLGFHGHLVECAGHRRLRDLFRSLDGLVWALALVAKHWGVTARDVPEHHARLLDALRSRDPERAASALLAHYQAAATGQDAAGTQATPAGVSATGSGAGATGSGAGATGFTIADSGRE